MLTGDTYDSTEDYNLRWQNSITAGAPIYSYKIIMQGVDGKFYPLTMETGTITTKTVSNNEFLPSGKVLYYNSTATIATNGINGSNTVYESYYGGNLQYTANSSSGRTAYMPLYLKGTIKTNGSFLLDNTTSTS